MNQIKILNRIKINANLGNFKGIWNFYFYL